MGLSATLAPLTSVVLNDVDKRQAGIASAVNNAISRIAGVVTIAAVGVVLGVSITVDGFHRVIVMMTVLVVIGGVIAAIGIRNHPAGTTLP